MAADAAAIKKSKIFGFVLDKTSAVSNSMGISHVIAILEATTNKKLNRIFLKDIHVLPW